MPDCSCIYEDNSADDERIFRLEELETAFKAAKNNQQAGPDELQMELLKWLDASNRARLLDLITNWWTERKAPQELFVARVVPIFKKKAKQTMQQTIVQFHYYVACTKYIIYDDDPI